MDDRKLSDEDVERLRHLAHDEDWSATALASAFGVTPQHVGRLLRGDQRPVIGAPAEALEASVSVAVAPLVADAELGTLAPPLAAMARVLAAKLDGCAGSTSAAAAQAMPRLTEALVDVLERLEAFTPGEPDGIDQLIAELHERREGAE